MPEGTVAFPHEPLLRVTAPFREALLLESGLLHTIGVATLIATKAARMVHAAHGRPIAEFGYRRAQEPHVAARSAFIGGCASTSFLAAAARLRHAADRHDPARPGAGVPDGGRRVPRRRRNAPKLLPAPRHLRRSRGRSRPPSPWLATQGTGSAIPWPRSGSTAAICWPTAAHVRACWTRPA